MNLFAPFRSLPKQGLVLPVVLLLFSLSLSWSWLGIHLWDHHFGDLTTTHYFVDAAHYFIRHGWDTYGLAVYSTGVYTHIPPGPEYLQIPIGWGSRLLGLSGDAELCWHCFWTAAFSLLCLLATFIPLKKVLIGMGLKQTTQLHQGIGLSFLLLLATPAVQVFSATPYCLGMYSANLLSFWVLAFWSENPHQQHFRRYLFFVFFSVFYSFWMALTPISSSTVWLLTGAFCFGEKKNRVRRTRQVLFVCGLALAFAVGLKIFQNELYFKDWTKTKLDILEILKQRQGVGVEGKVGIHYEFGAHLIKTLWRTFALFVFVPVLCVVLMARGPRIPRKDARVLILFLLGGLSWQLAMRQHAYYHNFFLRECLIPWLFCLAYLMGHAGLSASPKQVRQWTFGLIFLSLAQLVFLWGMVLIPAIAHQNKLTPNG